MSIASAPLPKEAADDVRIGEWRLAARRSELRRGDEVVHLEPKAAEVLAYLARHPGQVAGREDLLAAVWPGVIVGDDALTQAIIKLRKALGDDAHAPRYIETIAKRGYRLVATVSEASSGARPRRGGRSLLLFSAAAVVLVAIAALLLARQAPMPWPLSVGPPVAPAPTLPVVAVLPFENMSGDAREYFSDGITEDIITELGRFPGLRVMSYASVRGLKGKALSPQGVRTELATRYVVRGSVRSADGMLRVGVELADADKGFALWSERFEGEGTQLFDIQDRIVRRIAGSLQIRLVQIETQRAQAKPAGSLDEYDLKLRARSLTWRQDRRSNMEARALLARVLSASPNDGEGLVLLGIAEFERAAMGWLEAPEEAARRAEELARRALSLPDTRAHSRAHGLLSVIYSNTGRYADSLAHADQALALNPSDAQALMRRGTALLYSGRFEEGLETLEAARRIQPTFPASSGANFVQGYYMVGRYRDAISLAETLIARTPSDVTLHALRTASLARAGDLEGARRSAAHVLTLNPGFRVENFGMRYVKAEHRARLQEGLLMAGMD